MHNKRPSLAVSSGTTALHLSLVALGIKKGDEHSKISGSISSSLRASNLIAKIEQIENEKLAEAEALSKRNYGGIHDFDAQATE